MFIIIKLSWFATIHLLSYIKVAFQLAHDGSQRNRIAIGKGSFGTVYIGKMEDPGQDPTQVAIKEISYKSDR